MSKHYLLNGRLVTVSDSQWNGDSLVFAGSSYTNGQMPTVTFAGENRLTTPQLWITPTTDKPRLVCLEERWKVCRV
jgi:hypothetical protein